MKAPLSHTEPPTVDAAGAALPGIPVALDSVELGESVASSVAAHRIHAEPASLVTDLKGELHVQGIPRGAYTLHLHGLAGELVQQLLDVSSGVWAMRAHALVPGMTGCAAASIGTQAVREQRR